MDTGSSDDRAVAQASWWDRGVLVAVVLGCLLPFVGKALHIDDPVYVWTAEQITREPANFFGFEANWYGVPMPMFEINKNPPLVSYYMAAVGTLGGWSEVALHLGMMLPAVAMVLAVYSVARRTCASPLLAALVGWLTPVALVSSTTLMSDVLMLALWCGAVALWVAGFDERRMGLWLAAGLLMGLAPLAKYFGLALLPLLVVYGVMRDRGIGRWALALGVPIVLVVAYQVFMVLRYDWSPLLDVAGYAVGFEGKSLYAGPERMLVGLSFLGGCLLPSLGFASWLWSRRALLFGLALLVLAVVAAASLGGIGHLALRNATGIRWDMALQLALFGVAGVHVLAVAIAGARRSLQPFDVMLLLWIGGVWVFAAFINWTITARAVLPAAPALGLLWIRSMERNGATGFVRWLPLAAALVLSLWVGIADQRLANAARTAASELNERYGLRPQRYFIGGWGFQHYMESQGAIRLAFDGTRLRPRDIVFVAENNSNVFLLPDGVLEPIAVHEFPVDAGIAILAHGRGAGFYAALWGPLPWSFGRAPKERYRVYEVVRPFEMPLEPTDFREDAASSPAASSIPTGSAAPQLELLGTGGTKPKDGSGSLMQPSSSSQLSIVRGSPSSTQLTGPPGVQEPPEQMSPLVQALPSSHEAGRFGSGDVKLQALLPCL